MFPDIYKPATTSTALYLFQSMYPSVCFAQFSEQIAIISLKSEVV
jgi:hypothetical protein